MRRPYRRTDGGAFAIKYPIAPPLAEKMGAKPTKCVEIGGKTGQMAFVLAFPDFDKATGWFTGPEYAKVQGLRDEVSDFRMQCVKVMD